MLDYWRFNEADSIILMTDSRLKSCQTAAVVHLSVGENLLPVFVTSCVCVSAVSNSANWYVVLLGRSVDGLTS